MYIQFKQPLNYWKYFLSIEEELINTSKYVEFDNDNMRVFSTEFTKIILTASSEVDVLLAEISKLYGLTKKKPNFKDHFNIINKHVISLMSENVYLKNYGLIVSPFADWNDSEELAWHKSYNKLKHKRGTHYKEGNLENALLSVGALFTTSIHYYLCKAEIKNPEHRITLLSVIKSIEPKSKLFKFTNPLYQHLL